MGDPIVIFIDIWPSKFAEHEGLLGIKIFGLLGVNRAPLMDVPRFWCMSVYTVYHLPNPLMQGTFKPSSLKTHSPFEISMIQDFWIIIFASTHQTPKKNNTTNWYLYSHVVIHYFAHGSFQQSQSSQAPSTHKLDPSGSSELQRSKTTWTILQTESGDIPSDFHQHSMENGPAMKMYILLTMGIFHCYVGLPGDIATNT